MDKYHTIMDMWGNTMQYQFFSHSSMSALKHCTNNVPDNRGFKSQARNAVDIVQLKNEDNNDKPFIQGIRQYLEMLRKRNIQS
eukprot:15337772-Ditylum_brightwellii.AAC.1